MLSKLIIGLIFSISMRNAAVQPNPSDYEMIGGFHGEYGIAKTKFEREDGLMYRGLKVKTNEFKGFSAELEIDESNEVNRQYLYKTIADFGKMEILKIRTSNVWSQWRHPEWMAGFEFDVSTTKLIGFRLIPNATVNWQYDVSLKSHYISRVKYSFNLIDGKKFVLRPVYSRNDYNGDKSWQFKTELEINF